MFSYYLRCIFKRMDEDNSIEEAEIVRLEWIYFQALKYSERPAKTLKRAIASDPAFFVKVLIAVFLPAADSGIVEPDPIDREQATKIALQAFDVLREWSRVPGSDGEIGAAALEAWVKEARRLCAQIGRGKIGDQQIGQILSAARRRDNEPWPPEPVREIIAICRSRDLELGFEIGVYNSRGVTTRSLTGVPYALPIFQGTSAVPRGFPELELSAF
jgi:hypothetical protein